MITAINSNKIFLILTISITLISCSHLQKEKIIEITHGSSFGMCEGYCHNTEKYDKDEIIKYSHAWRNEQPDKIDTLDYSNFSWKEIVQEINMNSFKKLPSVIGCPDCADGGAEWIEIKTNDSIYKVEFEYGAEIKEIDQLLLLLRKN